MTGVKSFQSQDANSLAELFVLCEIQTMASRLGTAILALATRITAAVRHVFDTMVGFAIEGYSFLKSKILAFLPDFIATWLDPVRAQIQSEIAPEQRDPLAAEIRAILTGVAVNQLIPIPEDERESILALVFPLINPTMNVQGKRELIAAAINIRTEERRTVLTLTQSLTTQEMSVQSIIYLITAIIQIPSQQRGAVVTQARQLIHPGILEFERGDMVTVIAGIPTGQTHNVFTLASPLLLQGREGNGNDIIRAIAEVDADDRDDVIQRAGELITETMSAWDVGVIIQAIADIEADERNDVLEIASLYITEEMPGIERAAVITAIKPIPAEQRFDTLTLANTFIFQEMNGHEKECVISAIHGILLDERPTVIAFSLELIIEEMSGFEKGAIIKGITSVRAQERRDVLNLAAQLLIEDMDGVDKGTIIQAIGEIRQNRAVIIDQVRPLIIEGRGREFGERTIRAVAAISPEERANVIQHALELITPEMPGLNRAIIIQEIAALQVEQRVDYVRARRTEVLPLPIQHPQTVF